jgi:ketohexokinase
VLQQLLSLRSPTDVKLVLAAAMPSSSSAAVQKIQASLGDVDLDSCFYREDVQEAASSCIIRSEATNSRTIVTHNALPEMRFDEFVRLADSLGSDAAWYHFEVPLHLTSLYSSCNDSDRPAGPNPRCHSEMHTLRAHEVQRGRER